MTQRNCPNRFPPAHASVACRCRRRGSVFAVRLRVVPAALAGVLLVSGCAPLEGLYDQFNYNHEAYQLTSQLRNSHRADEAWERRASQFCGEPHPKDFGDGFRQGYCDVSNGEDGCPPPLPPRVYWADCFASPAGQRRIAAWFAGYTHGVTAAEEDAAGVFRSIYVSAELRRQYELQHAEPAPAVGTPPEIVPLGPAEPDRRPESGSPAGMPGEQTPGPQPSDGSPPPRSFVGDPARRAAEADRAPVSEASWPVPAWTPANFYRR